MALQRAHIELCVSIQIVFQQSLVDEGVLHLRRKIREVRGNKVLEGAALVLSHDFLLFLNLRHCCFLLLLRSRRKYCKWVQLSVRGTTGREGSTLTSVWMSWQRCSRILLTKPKTSNLCSMCIMSIMLSMTMNVPVLPTPALWEGRRHKVLSVANSQVRKQTLWQKEPSRTKCLHRAEEHQRHDIMVRSARLFNIGVGCAQPRARVKELLVWSPNTLLIDLQGSFQQTGPMGAQSWDSTADCWTHFSGPPSATIPVPQHLLHRSSRCFYGAFLLDARCWRPDKHMHNKPLTLSHTT